MKPDIDPHVGSKNYGCHTEGRRAGHCTRLADNCRRCCETANTASRYAAQLDIWEPGDCANDAALPKCNCFRSRLEIQGLRLLRCGQILTPLVVILLAIPRILPIVQTKTRVVHARGDEEVSVCNCIPDRKTCGSTNSIGVRWQL